MGLQLIESMGVNDVMTYLYTNTPIVLTLLFKDSVI